MEAARDGMMVELQQDVSESLKRLTYLLDVHTFTAEDMDLNKSTLLWPKGISPVFQENEQVQYSPPSPYNYPFRYNCIGCIFNCYVAYVFPRADSSEFKGQG